MITISLPTLNRPAPVAPASLDRAPMAEGPAGATARKRVDRTPAQAMPAGAERTGLAEIAASAEIAESVATATAASWSLGAGSSVFAHTTYTTKGFDPARRRSRVSSIV